jgi:hypothetical protein
VNSGRPDRDYYKRVSDLIDELRPKLPAPGQPIPGRAESIWRIIRIALVALCAAAALVYIADYGIARVRLSRGSALSTIEVARLIAIPQKSGKTELEYGGADTITCVHAIFPHFGYTPCWYAKRNNGVEY